MADFIGIKEKVDEIVTTALPDDFTVSWSFIKNAPKTWAYFGQMSWPSGEWQTNRSSEYQVSLPIVLNAIKPARFTYLTKTGPEGAERWLADQVALLTTAFNAASDLRSIGVITWLLVPRAFGSQPHVEGIEVQTALELRVTYRPPRP